MSTQHNEPQVFSKSFRRFIIIFYTLLAGVNLYLMLDLFWYKGFEFKHWFFTCAPLLIVAIHWSNWPRSKAS